MFDRISRRIGYRQDLRTDRRKTRSLLTLLKISFVVFRSLAINKYDYVFAENGLVAFKGGEQFFEEVSLFPLFLQFSKIEFRIFKNTSAKRIFKPSSIIVSIIFLK